jgi:Asp-tRNA(Asn)/Glu-tRNA(Gln) amidotransferase A subunit family amidase
MMTEIYSIEECLETIDIKNLKIAWTDEFGGVPVDDEIKKAIKEYVDKIRKGWSNSSKTYT